MFQNCVWSYSAMDILNDHWILHWNVCQVWCVNFISVKLLPNKKKKKNQKHKVLMAPSSREATVNAVMCLPDPGLRPVPDSLPFPVLHSLTASVFLKLGYGHYYIFKNLLRQLSPFSPFAHWKGRQTGRQAGRQEGRKGRKGRKRRKIKLYSY